MTLKIRDITLKNNVFLAPMSGISDLPFRRAVAALGAGGVVSEMVACEELAGGRPDMVLRAAGDRLVFPFILQLAGRETRWMEKGAALAEQAGADIVDINMGCPARQVTGALSGSALMRDLDHAEALIKATVRGTHKPVTLKMRVGWDWQSLNGVELAQRAEAAGVSMITVHGRTRQDFYKGTANWRAVGDIVRAVSIPVIVNGDIKSDADAKQALDQSGAAGVMVGRAAIGRPWLINAIAHALDHQTVMTRPSAAEQKELAARHYTETVTHYTKGHHVSAEMGRALGIRMARKHLAGYAEQAPSLAAHPEAVKIARSCLCRSTDQTEVLDLLAALFEEEADWWLSRQSEAAA